MHADGHQDSCGQELHPRPRLYWQEHWQEQGLWWQGQDPCGKCVCNRQRQLAQQAHIQTPNQPGVACVYVQTVYIGIKTGNTWVSVHVAYAVPPTSSQWSPCSQHDTLLSPAEDHHTQDQAGHRQQQQAHQGVPQLPHHRPYVHQHG